MSDNGTPHYAWVIRLLPDTGFFEADGLCIERKLYQAPIASTTLVTTIWVKPQHPDFAQWRYLPLMHLHGALVDPRWIRHGIWEAQLENLAHNYHQLEMFRDGCR